MNANRFLSLVTVLALFLLPTAILCGGGGCAQNTETPASQVPNQAQVTPTQTREYQKNAGPVIYVEAYNTPNPTTRPAAVTSGAVTKAEGATVADGTRTAKSDATYFVYQTVTINTGDQVPGQTGTTTGSATSTQTPSQTVNSTPTQTVEPSTAVPVSVALPGGTSNATGSAAASGGTTGAQSASPTQTATNTPVTVTGTTDKLATLLTALQSYLSQLNATTATTGTTATGTTATPAATTQTSP